MEPRTEETTGSSLELASPRSEPTQVVLEAGHGDAAGTICGKIAELAALTDVLMRIYNNNPVLEKLKVEREKYWELNDSLKGISYDRNTRKERLKNSRNSTGSCEFFLQCCYEMMTEMMDMKIIMRTKHDQVLNLCSAPGGFSKKLIEMSPSISVTAVTLPVNEPGSMSNIFSHRRQNLIFFNVVTLAKKSLADLRELLGCSDSLEWRRASSTDHKPKFDLAILDGAFATDKENIQQPSSAMNPDEVSDDYRRMTRLNMQLRMSEIAVAVATLKRDGMLIARSSAKIINTTLSVAWLIFRRLFKDVDLYSPTPEACKSMWSQCFIYFVCKGFQCNNQRSAEEFERLQRYCNDIDSGNFDFVNELLQDTKELEILEEKLTKVWEMQAEMFRDRYQTLQEKTEKRFSASDLENVRGLRASELRVQTPVE